MFDDTMPSQSAASPLADHDNAQRPDLTLQERPFRGHLNLRGQPDDAAFTQAVKNATGLELPVEPNTVVTGANVSALWLGPDEWLLVTEPGAQAAFESAINDNLGGPSADVFAGVTDVSSYYTTIEVAGHDAAVLLARGTPIDLHPREFGPGCCAQTLLAKTTVTIVQVDDTPVFEVIVRSSFADYLWCWLKDAAAVMSSATR